MATVRLSMSAYDRDRARDYEDALVNLMVERRGERVTLLPRPGFAARQSVTGAIRGMLIRSGLYPLEPGGPEAILTVAGTTAYLVDEFLGASAKGTIADIGLPLSMDMTAAAQRICNGGTVYKRTTGNFAAEAMPDNVAYSWIATLKGYWFAVRAGTNQLYFLRPGEEVWDALDFVSAEARPDFLRAVVPLNDDLWLFGNDSLEIWSLTGEADPALAPMSGQVFERGCFYPQTIARGDNTLFWVGNDSSMGAVVYRGRNGPERVSDFAIEEKLSSGLAQVSTFTVNLNGHELYVINRNAAPALVFDSTSDTWAEWTTAGSTSLAQRYAAVAPNRPPFFGAATGAINSPLTTAATDLGVPFTTKTTGFLPLDGPARCNRVELECSLRTSGVAVSVQLRTSDDLGNTWLDHGVRTVGQVGQADNRVDWRRLGLMRAPGRVFELSVTASEPVSFRSLEVT